MKAESAERLTAPEKSMMALLPLMQFRRQFSRGLKLMNDAP